MEIKENIILAPFTTFKIGGQAKFFCIVKDQFDALNAFEFAKEKNLPVFVLGGGSNVLISDKGFNGLVVKVENKGIEVLDNNYNNNDNYEDTVLVRVASGENWDEFVKFTVKNNWWGLENLSHIPGSTGAVAVQNVGAYGQEAKNVIEQVTVFNKQTHQILNLKNEECGFNYRSSIFNATQKGKYIIFYISFKLSKQPKPILNYRDLKNRFEGTNPSLNEIRRAVIEIRNKKYPFPTEAKLGNAGSFFKNPVMSKEELTKFKTIIFSKYGEVVAEKLDSKIFTEGEKIKIPAAFLMEISGLKDLQVGGAKINRNQPLVIVNETGKATAQDVMQLANKVIQTVYENFGIILKIEPELVGFSEKD